MAVSITPYFWFFCAGLAILARYNKSFHAERNLNDFLRIFKKRFALVRLEVPLPCNVAFPHLFNVPFWGLLIVGILCVK